MISIVYQSEALVEFDSRSLNILTERASKKNTSCGITGYLWFHKGKFVQYVEGATHAVTGLMESIKRDSRHEVLVECLKEKVEVRLFPTWNMKLFSNKNESNMHFEYLINRNLTNLQSAEEKQRIEGLLWRQVASLAKLQKQFDNPDL